MSELPTAVQFTPANTSGGLVCAGLKKSFGGVQALAGVNLSTPSSGILAITGPNGAGKTSLFSVITGFLRADEGRIFFDGVEITRKAPHAIARLGIARTFQEVRLVRTETTLANVMLAYPRQKGEGLLSAITRIAVRKEELRNRVEAIEVLRMVGLQEKMLETPDQLSHGQRKLLALAMCLATEARVILLDEPVSGVNPRTMGEIVHLLVQLKSLGKLILLIEHNLHFVRDLADAVVVMDHGRIIAEGVPAEVFNRPEVLEAYIGGN
jgi:ABC-type branched-subunit amino acid transport system ATPase component